MIPFENRVYVGLAFAVGLQGVVVPVDQEHGSLGESRRHGLGIARIEFDQDKALPRGAVPFRLWPQLVEEGLLELQDFLHVHADDAGLHGGRRVIGEDDIFEVVRAGRKDGSALVDFGGIEEVEDAEVLNLEDLVHTFDREATLAVEEVGDMGLFESGLLSQAEAGEFTGLNSLPQDFSEIILQDLELH